MGLMHLANDHTHPYTSAGGRRARCRVRIYLPVGVLDAPVVVCSECHKDAPKRVAGPIVV